MTEPEKYDVSVEDYIATFSSDPGRRVFTHLLHEFHVFEEAQNDEERIEQNIMMRILRNMGIMAPEKYREIAGALITIARARR